MADAREEFASLMQRVRRGSPEAARELLERYGPHVVRVIRRRLAPILRSKFDSADFLQAVWASFFADAPRHYTFDTPEALMGFLAAVARNKVIAAYRQRRQYRKYDVGRELPLEHEGAGPPARQPTPSQLAVAHEQWDRLLEGLPPRFRRALELLHQGHTHAEVAHSLDVNEKTLRRLLDRLAPRVATP